MKQAPKKLKEEDKKEEEEEEEEGGESIAANKQLLLELTLSLLYIHFRNWNHKPTQSALVSGEQHLQPLPLPRPFPKAPLSLLLLRMTSNFTSFG